MKNSNKQIAFTSIAALGAAGTASAVITHVSSPVELADNGDTWFLEGGTSGTVLAKMTSGSTQISFPGTFFSNPNDFKFAESGSSGEPFVKAFSFGNPVTAGIFDLGSNYGRFAFNSTGAFLPAWNQHFDLNTQAYAGFRFNAGDGTQYGWVSLTWQNDGDLILNEWAYADVGESINVGQIPAAVPESETVASALGLLVLGAAGMRRYQNRKRSSVNA